MRDLTLPQGSTTTHTLFSDHPATEGLKRGYEVSAAIRELINPNERTLLVGIGNIMSIASGDLLRAFCLEHGLKSIGQYEICSQIVRSTLLYGKPYEELEFRRLSQGKVQLMQSGTGTSERQISRDMSKLCSVGLVHRISRQGGSNILALNIDKLIDFIRRHLVKYEKCKGNDFVYMRELWKEKISPYEQHITQLARKVADFANVTANKTKAIIAELRSCAMRLAAMAEEKIVQPVQKAKATAMAGLEEMVAEAKASITATDVAKRDRRCGEPLFDRKGRGNGRAGLALWEKHARDYVTDLFHAKVTGKMIGQMKKYLEELRSEGKTEEQISEHIMALMKSWRRPLGHGREYNVPSKFGGTRKCMLGMVPDFESFFNDRTQITRLLFANALASEVQNIGGNEPPMVRVDFDM